MSTETMETTMTATTAPAPAGRPAVRSVLERFGLLIVLFGLIGIFTLVLPGTFFTSTNLTVTLPLRAGDFDLSVGMVMIGTGAVIAVLTTRHGMGVVPAVLIALARAAGIGLLNAALIVGLGIDAFIVTLGTMTWLAGVITAFTGGDVITGLPTALGDLANTEVLGSIPSKVVFGWLLALGLW